MSFAPHVPPSCGRCNQRIPHYPSQCSIPCSEGEHDIAATYQNYGYWHGQCSKCKKEWEVDSSG